MKKVLILIIVTLGGVIISCDTLYYIQLYVINNCNEPIHVSITDTWDSVDIFSVDANSTHMFEEGQGITSPKGIIEGSFVKFEVTKNSKLSKVNYKDFNRWICIEKENKYSSELYLPINPEDFE
jgi:hypothetical protein